MKVSTQILIIILWWILKLICMEDIIHLLMDIIHHLMDITLQVGMESTLIIELIMKTRIN